MCKSVNTPINGPILDDTPISHSQLKWIYKALGCCGWLSNTARPDGKYAHSRLSQHLAKPNQGLLAGVKHLIKYYKGAKHLCLYQPLFGEDTDTWQFFSDSDFAGNAEVQNKRRSQSGYIAFNGKAPPLWGSKPSSVMFDANEIVVSAHPRIGEAHADISSGASEVYAAGNATIDLLHLSYVMEEMDIGFPTTMKLQVDNTTAEAFMNNTCKKSKLKHIDCRQEWVKMLRNKDIVVPVHVDTEVNIADFFTKILSAPRFKTLRDMFMIPRKLN